jgi:hypothetical protein
LNTLAAKFGVHSGQTGDIAAGLSQALDETGLERGTRWSHNNWNCLGSGYRGCHRGCKVGNDDRYTIANKLGGKLAGTIASPLRIPNVKDDVAAV